MTHTAQAIEDELGWLFRAQPTEDYGIDAQIEVVDGEDVRGRLLALQIKGGQSWFKEPGPGGWWYRPNASHVQYWLEHSLPVIIVLYNADQNVCYWQSVSRETLVATKTGGGKVLVPSTQVLDASALDALRAAANGDPYELRVRELRLAKPWMNMLAGGTRLVVEFEEWVHKSSGRGGIAISIDHENGADFEQLVRWQVLIGPTNYADAVPEIFAWADLSEHQETYDAADTELYEAECSVWAEGEQYFQTSFADWKAAIPPDVIRPYANGAGEVDYFCLELHLNDLGRAFLLVDNFATHGVQQLTV